MKDTEITEESGEGGMGYCAPTHFLNVLLHPEIDCKAIAIYYSASSHPRTFSTMSTAWSMKHRGPEALQ